MPSPVDAKKLVHARPSFDDYVARSVEALKSVRGLNLQPVNRPQKVEIGTHDGKPVLIMHIRGTLAIYYLAPNPPLMLAPARQVNDDTEITQKTDL